MVTVKDLKKALSKVPNDSVLYLSSDEEGNSFGEIIDWGSATLKDGKKAVVLYPGHQYQFEEVFKLD